MIKKGKPSLVVSRSAAITLGTGTPSNLNRSQVHASAAISADGPALSTTLAPSARRTAKSWFATEPCTWSTLVTATPSSSATAARTCSGRTADRCGFMPRSRRRSSAGPPFTGDAVDHVALVSTRQRFVPQHLSVVIQLRPQRQVLAGHRLQTDPRSAQDRTTHLAIPSPADKPVPSVYRSRTRDVAAPVGDGLVK